MPGYSRYGPALRLSRSLSGISPAVRRLLSAGRLLKGQWRGAAGKGKICWGVPAAAPYALQVFLEHAVSVGRLFQNILNDVPVFHNLAVFDAEDVKHRLSSVCGCIGGMHMQPDQIAGRGRAHYTRL